MINISKIIIVATSMFVASIALATDWLQVVNDYMATVYINKESIKMQGDKVTYEEKWNFNRLQSLAGLKYNSMLTYRQFDCKEKTSGTTALIYFMDDKKVFSHNYPIDMQPIVPDSRDNHIYLLVCQIAK
jgi:hypothetical protein